MLSSPEYLHLLAQATRWLGPTDLIHLSEWAADEYQTSILAKLQSRGIIALVKMLLRLTLQGQMLCRKHSEMLSSSFSPLWHKLALSAAPRPRCHAASQTPLCLWGPQTYQAFCWDTAAAGRCNEATVYVHVYKCVCVLSQCWASSESILKLNEFLPVLRQTTHCQRLLPVNVSLELAPWKPCREAAEKQCLCVWR